MSARTACSIALAGFKRLGELRSGSRNLAFADRPMGEQQLIHRLLKMQAALNPSADPDVGARPLAGVGSPRPETGATRRHRPPSTPAFGLSPAGGGGASRGLSA